MINVSMFSFVGSDAILKFLGLSFPPNELIFLRSVIMVFALGAAIFFLRQRLRLENFSSVPLLARCLFDFINMIAFTTAVIHMNMAELYAISLTSPFIMTILAVIFLGEKVGCRRWAAIGAGFCGALLVIKPSHLNLNQWALMGLLAAFAAAARETVTRKIHAEITSIGVALYSSGFAAIAAFLLGLKESWPLPTATQSSLMLGQAATWLVGTVLLVEACRIAPLYLIATFRYALLVWGALASYAVFGNIPDFWSIVGAMVIVACGLYTLHRELVDGHKISPKLITHQ